MHAQPPSSKAPKKPRTRKRKATQHLTGRLTQPVNSVTQEYTASIAFDYRLALHDIEASLAHARMLRKQKVLTLSDLRSIEKGLKQIRSDIEQGNMDWDISLEDVHMNIEKRLIDLVGDAGRRLHTGRSRNDQVATDIRLYLRQATDRLVLTLQQLQTALVGQAQQHVETLMPGFTHLQVAQPITFAHHLLAYFEMFERDRERLREARQRINRLPLGAAALAGTTFPIDRKYTQQLLGFDDLCYNSLDAVSDRDFAIEFLANAAMIMMHLSRLAEEMILWMSPSFGFIDIADAFCTTSSIMPQKKNPDIPELARGKTGRVYGHLINLLTIMKAQPLAYNKDNQEDKLPLFDTVNTLEETLTIFAAMINTFTVNPAAMKKALSYGHATATDLADFLVREGLSFREAHRMVAQMVNKASELGRDLSDLSLAELQGIMPKLSAEACQVMKPLQAISNRQHIGGTAPGQIRQALKRVKKLLKV